MTSLSVPTLLLSRQFPTENRAGDWKKDGDGGEWKRKEDKQYVGRKYKQESVINSLWNGARVWIHTGEERWQIDVSEGEEKSRQAAVAPPRIPLHFR